MAAVLTGALMFEQLGQQNAANEVEHAVRATLQAGMRTQDLGGKATTADVAAKLLTLLG